MSIANTRQNESPFILQTAPSQRESNPLASIGTFLVDQRLAAVMRTAREILFDSDSKLIFFSDCHRGDRSRKDAFAPNARLFLHVLGHYYRQGFVYVEVGDGDELWQNRRFRDVLESHRPIFDMLHRFDLQKRLHLILGNHDVPFRWQRAADKDGMKVEQGLVLRHRRTGQRIFVTHGHQADIASDRLSPLSRMMVRYIWRYIQNWKILDLLLSQENRKAFLRTVERRLMTWAMTRHQMVICGHTHHAMAAVPGAPPYFNTGSCITPGLATGLEIQHDEISLVRWRAHPITGVPSREIITPPRHLCLFA